MTRTVMSRAFWRTSWPKKISVATTETARATVVRVQAKVPGAVEKAGVEAAGVDEGGGGATAADGETEGGEGTGEDAEGKREDDLGQEGGEDQLPDPSPRRAKVLRAAAAPKAPKTRTKMMTQTVRLRRVRARRTSRKLPKKQLQQLRRKLSSKLERL
mmetsp:Transcript_37990/g.84932  ORF Transcript_37990/g.84932 Transcript_37990/m.84932 type:complete len:158 (+) Transcript_37990:538-1011(+)